jgi:hypothetical protein
MFAAPRRAGVLLAGLLAAGAFTAQAGHCLTGRGLQGAPVVTAEKCITSGSTTKQEWKLGVSGDLQLRLNGLVAEVNPATLTGVRMALFTAKPNQKWHTHAVS